MNDRVKIVMLMYFYWRYGRRGCRVFLLRLIFFCRTTVAERMNVSEASSMIKKQHVIRGPFARRELWMKTGREREKPCPRQKNP